MTCYHPLKGWSRIGNPQQVTFNRSHAYTDRPRTVPCGQCVGCRLERSRQWAVRCHHEASLHEENCFVTLTYNPENEPEYGSLKLRDLQLFMKKLRKKYSRKIRFYACGEYGPKLQRPHYHLIIFNHDFADKTLWQENNGEKLYRSKELEKIWTYGFSSVGSVTFNSAAYVARYIMKKQNGVQAVLHYGNRIPEFTVMSRRPGIGANWLKKFASDVYPDDFVIINGKRVRPPRFYDQNFELIEPIKIARKQNLRKHAENNTPERLAVRETIQKAKLKQLPRDLKNGE